MMLHTVDKYAHRQSPVGDTPSPRPLFPAPATMRSNDAIIAIEGAEALTLMGEALFKSAWREIHSRCPWATCYQSLDYCMTWYQVYAKQYAPFVIISVARDGTPNAVMPLAAAGRHVTVAGANQAEYQGWICNPELNKAFLCGAARLIRARFPTSRLVFRFLPPGTPIDWFSASEVGSYAKLEAISRPVLRLDADNDVEETLGRTKIKNRLKQLAKFGPLEFGRVRSAAEFEAFFDEIISFYNLRQGAVHDAVPFQDDPLKKEFHRRLIQNTDSWHATVLRTGPRIAAAHFGCCSEHEVHLGFLAYSPQLAKHSPGKFHMLLLAQLLSKEGYRTLDLTPGGDLYKQRFANASDVVHEMTLFASRGQRTVCAVRDRSATVVKRSLNLVGLSGPKIARVKSTLGKVARLRTASTALRIAKNSLHRQREIRVYFLDTEAGRKIEPVGDVSRDCLDDLLRFQPAEPWQSRVRFLSEALERIENGMHVYTYVQDGRLVHYGWLIERQEKSFLSEVGQEFQFPAGSACLFDFYTIPAARGRGLYSRTLRAMVRDASALPGVKRTYITVLADNGPSRHVIEKVGFNYECSLFEKVWMGHARKWSTKDVAPSERAAAQMGKQA